MKQSSKPETVAARPTKSYVVARAPGQPGCRILIVEDKKENWMRPQRLFADAGFLVRVAEDGAQGVEISRTWQPHLILDSYSAGHGGVDAAA